MTKAELNRDVKKLVKQINEQSINPYSLPACNEFSRLHNADKTFKAFNAGSLRAMIILNRRYKYFKPDQFGLDAEY